MIIQNSQYQDIDTIFELYKIATDFMISKSVVAWPVFERGLVEKEIEDDRQWKIVKNGEIACVWATAEDDPQIWQERNEDPAIYIHRIATNPKFRGQNLVGKIVEWSKEYAFKKEKQFVRMDTVGENMGLINHYKKCGFDFLGLSKLEETVGLPAHYHNATVSLFQLEVK